MLIFFTVVGDDSESVANRIEDHLLRFSQFGGVVSHSAFQEDDRTLTEEVSHPVDVQGRVYRTIIIHGPSSQKRLDRDAIFAASCNLIRSLTLLSHLASDPIPTNTLLEELLASLGMPYHGTLLGGFPLGHMQNAQAKRF
jgi:hypothetical protein